MAKSKRKRALEVRNRKAAAQIKKYVIIGTIILATLMFLLFRSLAG